MNIMKPQTNTSIDTDSIIDFHANSTPKIDVASLNFSKEEKR